MVANVVANVDLVVDVDVDVDMNLNVVEVERACRSG